MLNFQFSYFPQYLALFTLGILFARNDRLNTLIESRIAKNIGLITLFGGPLLLGVILIIGGGPSDSGIPGEHGPILYFSGWSLHAFSAALWEQFTGLGLALGMLAWFKMKCDFDNKITHWISSRTFAVYVIHAPVIVWLTIQYHSIAIGSFPKILLLSITGLIVSFTFAELLKRTWKLGRFF